ARIWPSEVSPPNRSWPWRPDLYFWLVLKTGGLPVNDEASAQLDWAQKVLINAGFTVRAETRSGEIERTLHAYQKEHGIDLLVMGAYGHSRIRQFLVGSTTTSMLRTTTSPLLLLR
ncbi:universal stress protein, partial [Pseudomonas aeruginosa]|nr:universal stress protein [Pseudomonas aeruginosa]